MALYFIFFQPNSNLITTIYMGVVMSLNSLSHSALTISLSLMILSQVCARESGLCEPLSSAEDFSIDISRSSPLRCLPGNNTFQSEQWNLLNTGQDAFSHSGGLAGVDLNLWWAHRTNIFGDGINVAVVDDGLAIAHEDLVDNVRPGSKNFVTKSGDPTPTNPTKAHGTSVAGIIAAVDNDIGVLGVAPQAKLQGFNLLDDGSQQLQADWIYALGGSSASSDNHIFNQSYGASTIYPRSYNTIQQKQLESLFRNKTLSGAAYVKAAGNGFKVIKYGSARYYRAPTLNQDEQLLLPFENSNLDPANSNFWNLVVSAINANGVRSSYSTIGSSVFLSAPGGEYGTDSPAMVTTDLPGCYRGNNRNDKPIANRIHQNMMLDFECNYNGIMNGTSSATPNTSGAIALLMSAYPRLTVRDIRDLLARNATRVDPDHAPIVLTYTASNGERRSVTGLEGWEKNANGLWYSPTYGFGLIDVNKALAAAESHAPLSPLIDSGTQELSVSYNAGIIHDVGSEPTVSIIDFKRELTVEAVQVSININHERFSDLLIELVSPVGTRSILLNPYNSLVGQSVVRRNFGVVPESYSQMRDMRLLSHKFYGESALGEWRLEVTDVSSTTRDIIKLSGANEYINIKEFNNAQPGQLVSWSMRIFGH